MNDAGSINVAKRTIHCVLSTNLVCSHHPHCDRESKFNHFPSRESMKPWQRLSRRLQKHTSDDTFVKLLGGFEGIIAKVLSIAMLIVIVVAVADLVKFLIADLFIAEPKGAFTVTIAEIFGLFLNVLIAMELLENITAYLKKQVIQVELVIVTSLIAVSRKIIILDLEKTKGFDLIALAATIAALSFSYWLIRRMNRQTSNDGGNDSHHSH